MLRWEDNFVSRRLFPSPVHATIIHFTVVGRPIYQSEIFTYIKTVSVFFHVYVDTCESAPAKSLYRRLTLLGDSLTTTYYTHATRDLYFIVKTGR